MATAVPKYLRQFEDDLPKPKIEMPVDSIEILGLLLDSYFPVRMTIDLEDNNTYSNPYFIMALEKDTSKITKVLRDPITQENLVDLHDLLTLWGTSHFTDKSGVKTEFF